jgi:hypothetical protein
VFLVLGGIFDVDFNSVINEAHTKKTHALAMRGISMDLLEWKREKEKLFSFCILFFLCLHSHSVLSLSLTRNNERER